MRQLHDQLRIDHHLRHGGRMQYGLFLKGIGLTLQQSLTFWRKEFTKRMDPETVSVILHQLLLMMMHVCVCVYVCMYV